MSEEKNNDSKVEQELESLKRTLRLKEAEISLLKDELKSLKTGQHSTQNALKVSQTLVDSVFNNARDWIFIKNRDLKFELVNPAMCESLGIKQNLLLGRSEYEFLPFETAAELEKLDRRVLAGEQVEAEVRKQIGGEIRFFHCLRAPVHAETGEVISICCIARDITSYRKIEQDYQHLFQQMLDGFAVHEIICNADGDPVDYRFIDVNPAFEKLTGVKREDVIGRTVLEVFPETEKIWIEKYGKVALHGSYEFFENYSVAVEKFFEVTAFRPAEGQFACIFQDITERKLAEAESEKIKKQLVQSQKMESIGRLAGGVAHDFNNLTGIIMGCAEMAIMKQKKGLNIEAELEGIKKTAERSADLTRQLLAFARKQSISPQIINLNTALPEMLKMLHRLIGEDVELILEPASDLKPVRFDPGQLNQILTNLCINARDSIDGSGKIIISTCNEKPEDALLETGQTSAVNDYVCLAVRDTGSGIAEDVLNQIFEPFFTTKKNHKGTGLGLATVYGIVKQNQGLIKVASKLGTGTTFKIYIPAAENEPIQAEVIEKPLVSPDLSGKENILVVEDDEIILDLTRRILESFGYTVYIASRPKQGLAIVEEKGGRVDLLITDVVLPEMNGKELSYALKKQYPELKVLFMSGYTADIILTHGIDSESNFLQKPFHMQMLAEKVKEVLAQ